MMCACVYNIYTYAHILVLYIDRWYYYYFIYIQFLSSRTRSLKYNSIARSRVII